MFYGNSDIFIISHEYVSVHVNTCTYIFHMCISVPRKYMYYFWENPIGVLTGLELNIYIKLEKK